MCAVRLEWCFVSRQSTFLDLRRCHFVLPARQPGFAIFWKQRQEEQGGGHEGGVYAVGDPYKEDLPAAMKNNSRASPTGKKRKKKKKTTTGRRTIFG